MRRLACLALLLAAAVPARGAAAGTVFSDPYGVGSPDVLGSPSDFDIRSLELTLDPASLAIELRLDYHGGDASLAPFTVSGSSFASVPVAIGDVLIQGRSSLWAIPLASSGTLGGPGTIYYAAIGPEAVAEPVTRGTVLPGSLYLASGSFSAGEVLGVGPGSDLRADEPVWGDLASASPEFIGFVPVATSLGGAELAIQLQIAIGPAFYDDVSGGYRVHFASTTCACDVLDGAVPEPRAPALAALAALAAVLGARRGIGRARSA